MRKPLIRSIATLTLLCFLSATNASAAKPTAQQKIDRIHWGFDTIATATKVGRITGGWTLLAGGIGSAAISVAHWTDYALIPAADTNGRNRALAWGATSGLFAVTFSLFGSLLLAVPQEYETWRENVASISGKTPEERLSGYESFFRTRVDRQRSARIAGSTSLAVMGLVGIVGGFFPRDPNYRGLLWFLGGFYTGLSIPGFFLKGYYEREWDNYQVWSNGEETKSAAAHEEPGLDWALNLFPQADGLGAGATLRF